MLNLRHLKQTAKVIVITACLLAGYATLASAHSNKACCDMVRDFCGSDQSCISHGCNKCVGHGHPDGGNPPPAPDPVFSADPGKQHLNIMPNLKRRQ